MPSARLCTRSQRRFAVNAEGWAACDLDRQAQHRDRLRGGGGVAVALEQRRGRARRSGRQVQGLDDDAGQVDGGRRARDGQGQAGARRVVGGAEDRRIGVIRRADGQRLRRCSLGRRVEDAHVPEDAGLGLREQVVSRAVGEILQADRRGRAGAAEAHRVGEIVAVLRVARRDVAEQVVGREDDLPLGADRKRIERRVGMVERQVIRRAPA